MNEFRRGEIASFPDLFLILIVTTFFLGVVYLLLKKFRPYILKYLNANLNQKIKLVESRNIQRLGQVTIISVDQKEFLVVQTKAGVCVTPLESEASKENDKINHTSPQC